MPSVLKLTVEAPDEILNPGAYATGAIMRVQWSATEGGAFVDVSGTGSTPTIAIVTGTRIYTGYDPAGGSTTFYRTRYENSGATRLSDWTAVFQVAEQGATANYCSIYDAKQALTITDTTSDEDLLELIAQVSGWMDGYMRRPVRPDTATVYTLDGVEAVRHGTRLWISRGIRSISTLKIASSTGGTLTLITAADYFIGPRAMNRSPGWPGSYIDLVDNASTLFYHAFGNVEVTGTFGWAAVPVELEAIAQRVVVAGWRGRSAGGGDSITIGIDGERTFERSLSYQDRLTLQRYQRVTV